MDLEEKIAILQAVTIDQRNWQEQRLEIIQVVPANLDEIVETIHVGNTIL